ncbi:hypothetical protein SDC9_203093 [bioreactor metagenome]|uniref:ABC transporter ATP-binding protein n=1 Tax=bioreactor metagenome TaxID=1076179 RepID=A0A645IVP7_9ZZZZ
MDQGEIIEHGKHAELLERKGFYYDLYTSQFKNDSEQEEQNILKTKNSFSLISTEHC